MIVVDSSVLIPHFSDIETPEVLRLRGIVPIADVIIGDLVLLEVLQGARSERDASWIEEKLRLFNVVSMMNEGIAVAAARNYRRLRERGITIRKTSDLIIGTFCIENEYVLLHRDRDFVQMQQHLGLRIYSS
jgi:predicted nucleic acid-binding protein